MATAEEKKPARGAAKRGKEIEKIKLAVLVELISRAVRAGGVVDVYDLAEFARQQGLTKGGFWLLLKRLEGLGLVKRPKKSVIDAAPLLERLGCKPEEGHVGGD